MHSSSDFLQYIFYHTDPRRVQPLVDYIFQAFNSLEYDAELAFDATKVLSFFRATYEELGRKFLPWTDDVISRCWVEINSEHDDVSSPYVDRGGICNIGDPGTCVHRRAACVLGENQGIFSATDNGFYIQLFYSGNRSPRF